MLSRKVVTRRGRGFRGYFPSQKLGRMVPWESLNERNAILYLEFCRGVVFYQAQPEEVQYFDGRQMRYYYPDFEAHLADGRRLHLEIKPLEQLAKPEIAQKLRLITAHYLNQRQEEFRVIRDEELRREPLLTNLLALIKVLRHPAPLLPTQAELLCDLGGEFTLKSAEGRYGQDAALRLIALGQLECDLNLPLVSGTTVKVGRGGDDAALLI